MVSQRSKIQVKRMNFMRMGSCLDLSNSGVYSKLRPAVIAVAVLMFFVSASGVVLMLPLGKSGHVDFRHLYTAGYMVRLGHAKDIYEYRLYEQYQNHLVGPAEGALPFNHLAYEALFYVPFSFLTYSQAYFAFLIVNLLIVAASIRVLLPLFSPLAQIWAPLPVAIIVCFLPISIALIEGQDSLILLALFAAAIMTAYAQEDARAGALLGLTLFKFQYALPVVFLFFIWKRWRFLAGFAASGAAVIGTSVLLVGISGSRSYLQSLTAMSARYSSANGLLYGIHPDGMPNLRGVAYVVTGGSVSASHWIVLLGSAAVMICAAQKRPALPGALLTALLVSFHQMISDASLLILPLGLVLVESMAPGRTRREHITLALASTAIIGPTFLLFAGTRFYLLALPVLGVFAFWDWPSASPNNGAVSPKRPQTDTSLTLSRPAESRSALRTLVNVLKSVR
jgi:hypothetical protein